MDDVKERLIELETRYAHQAHQLDELNVELTRANERIDRLQREVKGMHEMFGQLAPTLEISPDE